MAYMCEHTYIDHVWHIQRYRLRCIACITKFVKYKDYRGVVHVLEFKFERIKIRKWYWSTVYWILPRHSAVDIVVILTSCLLKGAKDNLQWSLHTRFHRFLAGRRSPHPLVLPDYRDKGTVCSMTLKGDPRHQQSWVGTQLRGWNKACQCTWTTTLAWEHVLGANEGAVRVCHDFTKMLLVRRILRRD